MATHRLLLVPSVVLALATVATADAPPDNAALKSAAVALIDCLAAGEFAKALDAYDPPGRTTADQVRDDWQKATADAGPLTGRAVGDIHVRGTGIIAVVRCTFANKALDATLFCTPAGKVSRIAYLTPPLGGPGLIRAVMAEVFQPAEPGAEGTVTFPVPGPYRDQVPVAFRLEVDPPDALKGTKLIKRDDGINWLCEVTAAPQDKVLIRWEALVLVGDRPAVALPPAAKPEAPPEAAAWVRPGGCVQSTDRTIKAKAEELAKGTDDVAEYARRVIKFTTNNPYRAEFMRTLDARDALKCGSSCTGRANLAAALLRARGIPARTVAHLPTWCGPLFCHWLVEYWHPGVGWVWLEPTLDQPQPPPWTAVVVNVASPADEDDAYAWTKASGVAPGVPRRAARELAGGLRPTFDVEQRVKERIVNEATPAGRVTGSEAELWELFAAARRSFGEWSAKPPATDAARVERLLAAAKGGAKGLAEAVGRP